MDKPEKPVWLDATTHRNLKTQAASNGESMRSHVAKLLKVWDQLDEEARTELTLVGIYPNMKIDGDGDGKLAEHSE